MAAPKKYKTNTAKKSSGKKVASKSSSIKKSTTRVGTTKLGKRSFFKSWMAVPIILFVAIAGYLIVQFSNASSAWTFSNKCGDISGGMKFNVGIGAGTTACTKLIKADGGSSSASVRGLSKNAISKASSICVDYYAAKDSTNTILFVNGTQIGSHATSGNRGGNADRICGKPSSSSIKSSGNKVIATVTRGWVGVRAIYGVNGSGGGPGGPSSQSQPADPLCGKVVMQSPITGWITTNRGATQVQKRRDKIRNCDYNHHKTVDKWGAWYVVLSRPNPNLLKNQCNNAQNYLSSYYRTIPGGHGEAKQWRNPYWQGNTCRNKFSSWSKPTLKCDGGYHKVGFSCKKNQNLKKLPWAFCKDKNKNNCIKTVLKQDSEAIYKLKTCDLRMHAGYHSFDKCKERKGAWKRP